jgi:opacity protein-like surface antigen
MRNKAIFLATTAVALVSMSSPANAEGIYVSVFGGLNLQPDSSAVVQGDFFGGDATTAYSESADTGFVLGGAIGAHLDRWAQGLRTELEISYRRNDIDGWWSVSTETDTGFAEGLIGANTSTFAIMANVWYEFDLGSKARPYVGGGAGWARSKIEVAVNETTNDIGFSFNESTSYEESESGFAWTLGAGVNYEVSPGVDVGIGYRYFNGPGFDPLFIGKNNIAVPFDNENHAVSVNLTVNVN